MQLSAAVTYHKVQGQTCNSIILSLNSHRGISKKIHTLSLPSLYVGCSRVYNHDHLRKLSLSNADKTALKQLKWDDDLRLFFNNYDKQGKWKIGGLKKYKENKIKKTILDLGMINLNDLTKADAKRFTDILDLIINTNTNHPLLSDYITALKQTHNEASKLLNANSKISLD